MLVSQGCAENLSAEELREPDPTDILEATTYEQEISEAPKSEQVGPDV
jgi:hypothetical protein